MFGKGVNTENTAREATNIVGQRHRHGISRRGLVCDLRASWQGRSGDGLDTEVSTAHHSLTPPDLHTQHHPIISPGQRFCQQPLPHRALTPGPRDRPTPSGADSTSTVVICSPAASLASPMAARVADNANEAHNTGLPPGYTCTALPNPTVAPLPQVTSALPRHETDTRQPRPNPTPARSCRRPCCICIHPAEPHPIRRLAVMQPTFLLFSPRG